MTDVLQLIGRQNEIFSDDIYARENALNTIVSKSRFLVLGGAGTIGQAVTKEIFKRQPKKLYVVDISENNLAELVRDIRSSFGYIDGDFQTYALDIGSVAYDAFIKSAGEFDYVLNLSALKHVRSEKDPFTLMRMIDVNIFNTLKTLQQSVQSGVKKYFCVSTDKAANPVNMMGASKRIMEMYLMRESQSVAISTARFANVAFSDGSLLHSFNQRLQKNQPIVAPNDIKRYFLTPKESGELCLMSCIFGDNRDIFFPKLSESLHLITFAEIAEKYVRLQGYAPYHCESEQEARSLMATLPAKGQWPCLFTSSDTTGEKDFEEFFTADENVNMDSFKSIGVIQNALDVSEERLHYFSDAIDALKRAGYWEKAQLVELFSEMLNNFNHLETGKYLDSKM
ncbi:UDP-N-acetylglucosamine 4,6-dehydratase [Salinimonas iocasae]|uniref:UDP-N-acetylglucosamine 4,6-dehydratase n=1 Tax=Salinimonas iocasae TaxID=2572577 RepID=A0A5B7YF09_9ALTE|nr:UDP-N-acetylglucosamine 4,6-dehydratase [Salinimonas iocasae]QCZ94274.1 UDP-N-acetylglucosamine 4,6-dehydratase [Salinimonas iocasae]